MGKSIFSADTTFFPLQILVCAYKHVPRQAFRSVENYINAGVYSRHNAECMMNDCDECCVWTQVPASYFQNPRKGERDYHQLIYLRDCRSCAGEEPEDWIAQRCPKQTLKLPKFTRHAIIKPQSAFF